jgi:hypothetical protein
MKPMIVPAIRPAEASTTSTYRVTTRATARINDATIWTRNRFPMVAMFL